MFETLRVNSYPVNLCSCKLAGPGCSKLKMSLGNVFVKISNANISNLPTFFVEKM